MRRKGELGQKAKLFGLVILIEFGYRKKRKKDQVKMTKNGATGKVSSINVKNVVSRVQSDGEIKAEEKKVSTVSVFRLVKCHCNTTIQHSVRSKSMFWNKT